MGKKQHSKDRMFITKTEWATEWGGAKSKENTIPYKRLPFYCCSLTFTPFEDPVCTDDGSVFDLMNIVPYIRKFGKHPVNGGSLKQDDLIPLTFHKNSDGEFHCPVLNKVFTEFTHIVAVKTTGNVFSYEAIKELNIKTKNWKELLTDEPFTKDDLITIQNPNALDSKVLMEFDHVKRNLKLDDDELQRMKDDPAYNMNVSGDIKQMLLDLGTEKAKQAALLGGGGSKAQNGEIDSGSSRALRRRAERERERDLRMAGDRDADEETRNIMMQNLFGDQSEEEEEEEEVDSEHEAAANQSDYPSEDVEADAEIEVDVDGEQEVEEEQEGQELEAEAEGEDEGEVDGEDAAEGQGEVEVESELEAHDIDVEQVESEGERVQSSPEREVSDERAGSEGKYAESEDEGYGQRAAISRRREVYDLESEGSEENHFAHPHNEDEEVDNARNISSSPVEQKDKLAVRDVFGDSDVDEEDEYGVQNDLEQDSHRSPMEEEEIYEKDLKPEDIVPDEDAQYEFEDENLEQKTKEKPIGPPLEMNIPLHPAPGRPDQMHMIRVSNIMGIEPKPFDSMTYVEEDVFVTDESGTKKRIRLEDNIVRWRTVKNRDGTTNYESNARFVQWSDGSLQLLIGNEVLDISVQEADHDQAHLFLRHGKGILQSQGRLLRKMKFMPSSLSSKSHRLLTALVDSRHKKVYKVKNCITDIDPEREKEEKRKIEGQTIRANEQLNRKREKVNRKYSQPVNRGRQLSPGFLEDALDEEEEHEDYYSSRKFTARRRFEDDLEAEAQAEKRIINAKRPNLQKSTPRKPALPAARLSRRPVEDYSESEREESEYESDGEDIEASPGVKDKELDYEDEYEEEADEEAAGTNSASEEEEPRRNVRESGGSSLKRKEIDSDVDSPPRKAPVHRRKAVVFDSDDD